VVIERIKASIINSYVRYGFGSKHKNYILQIRKIKVDNGKEIETFTSQWEEIAESDSMKELFDKGKKIDSMIRCPSYYSHHLVSICTICGMKD